MKILGIDTSTRFFTVGIFDNGKICEYALDVGARLSSLLGPGLKMIMEALEWRPQDIDYFACGVGPGSFTGMRIGLAAIKGMSWSQDKPVIGISTLDILARNCPYSPCQVLPVIDAKRNLVYCSAYKIQKGRVKRTRPYMLLGMEEVLGQARPESVFLGDALGLYREKILQEAKGPILLSADYWYPKGHNIIAAALEKIRAKDFEDAFSIKPAYLYPKECQIKKGRS